MQLHQLKTKNKSKRRIGRGGKKGTYCGKGIKGQKCRAGRKMQPMIREIIKRYPKLKGYRENPSNPFLVELSLNDLEVNFKDGEIVSPEILIAKEILGTIKGKMPQVKILDGEIKKKLTIENCKVSKQAKLKIEKQGGLCQNGSKN